MNNKTIRTAFVLLIIAYYLITAWITIFNDGYLVKWQHITAVLLYIPLPILLFKNYKVAVLGTGIYLLVGLLKGLSLTVGISTGTFSYLGLEISGFNWLSLGLLVLHLILHVDILIEIQLDYRESKVNKIN